MLLSKRIRLVLTGILLVIGITAFAENSPVDTLQSIATPMVTFLKQHQAELNHNPKLISSLVERVLVPHIDRDRMAGMVVGRSAWLNATPLERQQFIDEFKSLVISTYANALTSFHNDRIEFYPDRDGASDIAVVKSAIIRENGQRIAIVYNLHKNDATWKIYDFSIEGVSLVASYQSQFSDTLAQGGLTALIKKLMQYNQEQQK